MLAPSTLDMNTGSRLCTSSEEISMNMEVSPNPQMPTGRARSRARNLPSPGSVYPVSLFMRCL